MNALGLLARPGMLPPAHQAAIADGDTAGARCAVFKSLNASFHHHSAKAYAALRHLKTPRPKIS